MEDMDKNEVSNNGISEDEDLIMREVFFSTSPPFSDGGQNYKKEVYACRKILTPN